MGGTLNPYAIRWGNIETNLSFLPELEERCHQLIFHKLGYVPHQSAILPHEPYLRFLLQRHQLGEISELDLHEEAIIHVKHIRNKDMEEGGWIDCLQHGPDEMDAYRTEFPQHRYAAREGLTRFLGYEPHLDHSMEAELFLREILAKGRSYMTDRITTLDLRLITAIKYREVLLAQGKAAADASPLFNHDSLKNTGYNLDD